MIFVVSIKQPVTEAEKYKARFILQGHKCKQKEFIIHISRTVSHKNIKILISISVIYKLNIWNQDVNQAYIQAHDLERDFYVITDFRFNLPLNIVLQLLNPLHSLSESKDSFFNKYALY